MFVSPEDNYIALLAIKILFHVSFYVSVLEEKGTK